MMDIPSIVETNIDNSSVRDEEEDNLDDSIARYTCFTGVFEDGFSLSFSNQKLSKKKRKIFPEI